MMFQADASTTNIDGRCDVEPQLFGGDRQVLPSGPRLCDFIGASIPT